MDSTSLTWVVFLVSSALILALVYKLKIVQDWRKIQATIRGALADRLGLLGGILAALIYAFVFLVFGGQGGRLHYFYGRWIFNMTVADGLLGITATILVAVGMAIFIFSLRLMGLRRAGKGGLGIAGTLLAVVAAFCP